LTSSLAHSHAMARAFLAAALALAGCVLIFSAGSSSLAGSPTARTCIQNKMVPTLVRRRVPLSRVFSQQPCDGASRREMMAGISGTTGVLAGMLMTQQARADEESAVIAPEESAPVVPAKPKGEFGYLRDPILSYSYKYPIKAGNVDLKLTVSRKPEKYSSAAPLSSNFRHRIVNQMLDYNNVVVYAMYVCPAIGILKRFPPSDWTSQQVADTILLDRLNAKSIEEGRRYLEENVEGGAKYQDEDGTFYFQYEHLEPGKISKGMEPEGRHNLAVTAARPGQDGSLYMFSLNMGCPEKLWEEMKPALYEAANSFRVDPLQSVAPEYVPPDKDPWAIL